MESRGNRPLKMNFEDQLNALIFFHNAWPFQSHNNRNHMVAAGNADKIAMGRLSLNFYDLILYFLGYPGNACLSLTRFNGLK